MISAFLYVSELLEKSSKMEDVERVCKPLSAYKIYPFVQQTCIVIVCYDTGGWRGGAGTNKTWSLCFESLDKPTSFGKDACHAVGEVPIIHKGLVLILHLRRLSEVKSLSRVQLFATPWTVAYQASPSMGFSRQEYWSGLLFPSPGDLPDPGIEPALLLRAAKSMF